MCACVADIDIRIPFIMLCVCMHPCACAGQSAASYATAQFIARHLCTAAALAPVLIHSCSKRRQMRPHCLSRRMHMHVGSFFVQCCFVCFSNLFQDCCCVVCVMSRLCVGLCCAADVCGACQSETCAGLHGYQDNVTCQ